MQSVFLAYARALRSLARPDIFWHLLWPTLLAIAVWTVVGIFFWAEAVSGLIRFVQSWPLVGGWFGGGHDTARTLFAFAVNVVLVLMALPLVYVTAALIVSVFAMPLMLDRVAATDYRDLVQHKGGSMAGSVWNALAAFLFFLLLAALSLPLWFVPGLGLFLSLGLAAWLNKRCYSYDALMSHADADELRRLPRERRGGLYALGIGAGVLGFVPIVNLLAPAFTGLAFVHYLLEALRCERARPMRDVEGTVL